MIAFALRYWLPLSLAALLAFATLTAGVERSRRQHIQQEYAEARAQAAEASAKWEAAQRQEESRRTAAVNEARNEAIKELDKVRRDAAGAAAAGDRLRDALNIAARALKSCGDSSATPGSPSAGPSVDLLERVQQRLDASATELAGYADRARIAGQACQSAYNALTPRTSLPPTP